MGEAAASSSLTGDLHAVFATPDPAAKWAKEARAAALARFYAMGVPGRRDEYWKYTDPTLLTAVPGGEAAVLALDEAPIFSTVDALKLVFVDGTFRPDLSDATAMDACEIQTLRTAMDADIHWASDVFGVLETAAQENVARPLAALNTASAVEGFAIRITGRTPRPIIFEYLHEDTSSDVAIHHVIRVESGAEGTILESGPAAARFNKLLEIDIADGGTLHLVRAQGRDHERRAVTGTYARLREESVFKAFTLTANGVLTRNETIVELLGDNGVAHVAGACVGDGDFHHDDTVFVTHDAVGCESRQVYKKVLKNGAVGVFQGKILVKPQAQKTDGYQISQGLLLDEDSQFLAKPELEIYADDVACSHGSTSGSVDPTQLFYLTSRGIPRRDALDMLVLSFLAEALDEIEDEAISEIMVERLSAWMARRRQV